MYEYPVRKGLAALVLFVCALAAPANASVTALKRVLLVYQTDGYSPASLEFQQSLLTGLQKAMGRSVDFYCEQLDSQRLHESPEMALAQMRSRYAGRGIDLVIFNGSIPTQILPGVPVLYVGNLPSELANFTADRQNLAAVWFRVDLSKTLSVARRLQPKADKVLVISGSGVQDRIYLSQARDQLKASSLPVEYLSGSTVNELLVRVRHLSPRTIVLPLSYVLDSGGHKYYTRDVVVLLCKASAAPVYAVSDTYIGAGAVGGYVVSFARTGEVAAEVASQILQGKPAAEVPAPPEGTGIYLFDWKQLRRWGFSERDLPPESVVRFRSPGAWELYRWRIVATAALILAQLFLIFRLLFTQRKRARAQAGLRDMTGRLLVSQDEERRRFARDLHDGTGQHLSVVARTIGQVLAKFPVGNDALRKLLEDSHSASRQALDEVRSVSFALHPPLLDNLGLVAAMRWYLDGIQKQVSLKIDFKAAAEIQHLASEAERALFRILQESISNVLRHSRGNVIHVALSQVDNTVVLEVEDNGKGMATEQLTQAQGAAATGVGIAGMRERVRQLNGKLKISSSERGTTITATVPVEQGRYAAAHSMKHEPDV